MAAGLVKLLPVRGFPLDKYWYAVVLRDRRLRPVAQTFLEFLASDGAALLKANLEPASLPEGLVRQV
jgi:DNA-binding transcriptional LysR family regulator